MEELLLLVVDDHAAEPRDGYGYGVYAFGRSCGYGGTDGYGDGESGMYIYGDSAGDGWGASFGDDDGNGDGDGWVAGFGDDDGDGDGTVWRGPGD